MKKIKSARKRIRRGWLSLRHPRIAKTIRGVIDSRLTYLDEAALWDLALVAMSNERKKIRGIVIETGCALGGSSIVLAQGKKRERELFVYDVFSTIPPPSDKDDKDVHARYEVITSGNAVGIKGDVYYGYERDLYDRVVSNFAAFNLDVGPNRTKLVKGLYEDTLRVSEPVSLAHIDCDWYESVIKCLAEIEPRLVKGGTMVIDDYYAWSGCRKAVDDYFADKDKGRYQFVRKNRLQIVKAH